MARRKRGETRTPNTKQQRRWSPDSSRFGLAPSFRVTGATGCTVRYAWPHHFSRPHDLSVAVGFAGQSSWQRIRQRCCWCTMFPGRVCKEQPGGWVSTQRARDLTMSKNPWLFRKGTSRGNQWTYLSLSLRDGTSKKLIHTYSVVTQVINVSVHLLPLTENWSEY